jgi:glycopeptide antibiotics resistance protein/uncharacterized RDD family membrane protein YckC
MTYLDSIKGAFYLFPIIAFIITIPFILYSYRKYGTINILRAIITYSFILYLLIAYFLVILPLPSNAELLTKPSLSPQLIPFRAIYDIIEKTSFNITNYHTYLKIFQEPWIYQLIYNALLTAPFAIYLRYYFKKNLKQVIFSTFLLSLFFELTQLTGLYGIYIKAYRLFDVDDLIVNTLGGIFGYFITPLFERFLPTHEELELKTYKGAQKVSKLKRLVAFILDLILTFIITYLIYSIISHFNLHNYFILYISAIIGIIINFIIVPIISKGATFGKKFVHLKMITKDNNDPKWYQYLLKYLLMFGLLFMSPIYIVKIGDLACNIFDYNITIKNIIEIIIVAILLFELLFIFIKNIILNKPFIYEKVSKIINISTVTIPDNLKKLDQEKSNKK